MGARTRLSLIKSVARAGFLAWRTNYLAKPTLTNFPTGVSCRLIIECVRNGGWFSRIDSFLSQPLVHVRYAAPIRSLWNGWKLGFSSSSAQHQDDRQQQTGSTVAENGGAIPDAEPTQEPQEQLTADQLREALAIAQESLKDERKKARHIFLQCAVFPHGIVIYNE